jgi:hypothetical protein
MKEENWIKKLKNLKLSGWYLEGTEIPVEIVGFIEKLLHQEKERLINEIKQITSNGEKWKTKKLFALLDELKNKKGRQK